MNPEMQMEPFVDSEQAAKFLCVSRRHLLVMARRGLHGAYSLGTGTQRKMWVFRLSELAQAITSESNSASVPRRVTMASAVPAD
jgi:hypothetical protein